MSTDNSTDESSSQTASQPGRPAGSQPASRPQRGNKKRRGSPTGCHTSTCVALSQPSRHCATATAAGGEGAGPGPAQSTPIEPSRCGPQMCGLPLAAAACRGQQPQPLLLPTPVVAAAGRRGCAAGCPTLRAHSLQIV